MMMTVRTIIIVFLSLVGFRVFPIEDCGKAGYGDQEALCLGGKLVGKLTCHVLEVLKADLDQFVVSKSCIESGDHTFGDSVMTDHDYGIEALGLTSEMCPFLAGYFFCFCFGCFGFVCSGVIVAQLS